MASGERGDLGPELTPHLPSGFFQPLPSPLLPWGQPVEEELGVVVKEDIRLGVGSDWASVSGMCAKTAVRDGVYSMSA